jgi:hypothetical protein
MMARWITMGFDNESLAAREAKNEFGRMIGTTRASPVIIEKRCRGVVIVVAV